MQNPQVKILCTLFIYGIFKSVCPYPQFSIPFVSWNNNKANPSWLPTNIRVDIPLSSRRFNGFSKYNTEAISNNDIVNNKIVITVTPHSDSIPESYISAKDNIKTTQSPKVIETPGKGSDFGKENNNKDEQNEPKSYDIFKEDESSKYIIREESDNAIEVTTDYTTETSTDYESTTSLDEDIYNRSGISSNVVASLLG